VSLRSSRVLHHAIFSSEIVIRRNRAFNRWSDALIGIFVGGPEVGDDRLASLTEMLGFFDDTVARRRSDPGDELISMLTHKALDDEEPLTGEELVWFCVLLLVAGNETTTNLLSNALKVLASDPTVLGRLFEVPALIPGTVEEVLRYDAPVQSIPRGTSAPIQVDRTTIPADAILLAYMGAANRDERHFPDPDRFASTQPNRPSRLRQRDPSLPRGAPRPSRRPHCT
jgi:cytochrome P450